MDIKSDSSFQPPSSNRIEWFEKAYRVSLPADYVEFLHIGNGGVPVQKCFMDSNRERMLESFLCLIDNPLDDSENGWRDITVVITQLDDRLIDDESLIGINVFPDFVPTQIGWRIHRLEPSDQPPNRKEPAD